jgi:hypothetical protein
MARHTDFVTEVRKHNRALWTSLQALKGLQAEWSAQDYGTTMADPIAGHEGYTNAMVGSVLFATTDAIDGLMGSGHATNVTDLL